MVGNVRDTRSISVVRSGNLRWQLLIFPLTASFRFLPYFSRKKLPGLKILFFEQSFCDCDAARLFINLRAGVQCSTRLSNGPGATVMLRLVAAARALISICEANYEFWARDQGLSWTSAIMSITCGCAVTEPCLTHPGHRLAIRGLFVSA